MAKQYWLAKSEPECFSWQDLVKDGETTWDGVRNYAARNNLRAMDKGDDVLFYHSVLEKCVVGIASVSETHFPDPSDNTGQWSSVKMKPKKALKKTVSLQQIKENPLLQSMQIIKNSRLSVMPVTKEEFEEIVNMSK